MSRRASALAVALVSLCWQVPVQGVFVKFPVQLALSDNEFFPSGTVYGDIEENVSKHVFRTSTFDPTALARSMH